MVVASPANALIGGPNPNSPGFPLKTYGNDGLEVQQTAQISLAIIRIDRIMDFDPRYLPRKSFQSLKYLPMV